MSCMFQISDQERNHNTFKATIHKNFLQSKSIIYRNIHPLYPAPVSHGLSRVHVVHIHNYRGRGGSSSSKSSKKSRKGKSSGYKKRKYRRYRKYGLRYRRATEDLGGKSSRSSQGYWSKTWTAIYVHIWVSIKKRT